MSVSNQSDRVLAVDTDQPERIAARELLTACAVCSLGAVVVLAGVAQTLVWLWGPAI